MGKFSRVARASVLAATRASVLAAIGILAATSISGMALATTKSKKTAAPVPAAAPADAAAEKQKDADAARRAFESGAKSYQAGKYQPAVDELSAALRGGGLSSTDMAHALYYRGLAYKKQSKPGLAISDLTSALWLKNGLADADRQTASAERSEAYRMAGLGDGNSGAETVSVADPNVAKQSGAQAVVATPATSTAKPVISVATPAGGVTRQSPDSEAARDAAAARKIASAPVESGGLQAAATGALTAEAPRLAAVAVAEAVPAPIPAPIPVAPVAFVPPGPSATPPASGPVLAAAPIDGVPASNAQPAAAAAGVSSTVSGFFKDLFGGNNSGSPSPTAAPVTTASTTPTVATSSWSDTTSVAGGSSKKRAEAKSVQQAAATAPANVSSGKYKVHIAAVRSRQEAETLAQKLASQHGAVLKNHSPVVDEAVIGSMGTFYRVRIGSYATADEPRSVCNTLRSSGYDCLVVTN